MWLPPRAASRAERRGALALLAMCLLPVCGPADAAEGARIMRLRHFSGIEHTRIVLDLDRSCSFEVRRVENPDRIAVNLPGAVFAGGGDRKVGDGLVDGIRCSAGPDRAQIVLDLSGRREFKVFSLPPSAGKPDRIVIDVLRGEAPPLRGSGGAGPSREPSRSPRRPQPAPTDVGVEVAAADGVPADPVATEAATAPPPDPARPFVVVIDPGHGGDDPGAMRGSLREKDICLDIAQRGGEIAERRSRCAGGDDPRPGPDAGAGAARRHRASRQGGCVLSIHCNTHPRPAVSGMEVYFLSLQGATDRESRELADKENAAGLVGLPPGGGHADMVVDILMDLKMTRVLQDSGRLAASMLSAADRSGVVPGRRVKQAGFQVLKTLAMPSALVEVAYMSNPDDHRLLNDPAGRRRLAGVDRRRDRGLARGRGTGAFEARSGHRGARER